MFVLVTHCTAVALARALNFTRPSLRGDLTNFMEVARRTLHCAFVETNIIKATLVVQAPIPGVLWQSQAAYPVRVGPEPKACSSQHIRPQTERSRRYTGLCGSADQTRCRSLCSALQEQAAGAA